MTTDDVRTGPTNHQAQGGRDDDGVVGIADYRQEVRNQIDRRGKVRKERVDAKPHPVRDRAIGSNASKEPHRGGQDPKPFLQDRTLWPENEHRDDQRDPHDEESSGYRDQDVPHRGKPEHGSKLAEPNNLASGSEVRMLSCSVA